MILMKKLDMLYEGKAKKVFATEEANAVIVEYKDDATAFNGEKRGTILGKGVVNNRLSNHLFRVLEARGIPTHYIDELSDRETLVKKVRIIPLEVIVRNVAAGSMSKRYGVEEGRVLSRPVLEYSYKNDALGDPMISESHILALQIATQEELNAISALAAKINEVLKEEFLRYKLKLIDFKLEFGTYGDQILLADEISPDTCRLWDADTNEKLDKDRFRRDLGNVVEAYEEVARRILGE
jgi:phosphoribosylaminoimidazole-succinocarboxamide synthase